MCKLCGRHLYETITFSNLFRWRYDMHPACERTYHKHDDFIVVPMLDQLVHYDYLFPKGYEESDRTYLFERYLGTRLWQLMQETTFSLVVLLDEMEDQDDLSLVIGLGDGNVLLLVLFDETVVTKRIVANE